MFGLLIALAIGAIKLSVLSILLEDVLVDGVRFLFHWYISTGVVTISLGALAWAGDLGTEGARLRHGIISPLSWMIGVPRLPLRDGKILLFLAVRRLLLVVGAYLLTRGLQAVGATFIWDGRLLLAGGIILGLGLIAVVFSPILRRLGRHP